VIGGGIFVITGRLLPNMPARRSFSFVLAAICSSFTALCYAEFATLIPMSGSSYSYAYATLGELVRGSSAGTWCSNTASQRRRSRSAGPDISSACSITSASICRRTHERAARLYRRSPRCDGRICSTCPRLAIVLALTWLCYVGIRESSGANACHGDLKVSLIVIVIVAGWHYMNPGELAPLHSGQHRATEKYGWSGIMRGAPWCSLPTSASRPPRRPRRKQESTARSADRHIASLAICTFSIIGMAAVITGLLPFGAGHRRAGRDRGRAHPQLGWLRWVVEVGAMIGLSSVILVMIIAQPRIFMIMAATACCRRCSPRSIRATAHRTSTRSSPVQSASRARCGISARPARRSRSMGTLIAFVRGLRRRADSASHDARSAEHVPRAVGTGLPACSACSAVLACCTGKTGTSG
jgi:APA family basic amino acid/polyamine antiporter